MPQSLLLRHRSRRNRHLLALINEMGWLPPSLTASRCASVFLVQATNGKDGNHEYRSEEHTSELQSLMRISYAVFCLKKKQRSSTKSRTPWRTSCREWKRKHRHSRHL